MIDDQVRLIGVIEGREKAKVKAFLKSIPGRLKRTITDICCDMYDGYVNAAGEALPKVPVMIDRFHVAKLYRKALVKVRQAELARLKKRLSPEDYQALKPSIAILKRNAEVVSKEERQELERLFLHSFKLKAAYRYCRKLTGIFNSKIGKQAASDRLEAWMAEVECSSLTQFDRLIETLRKYKDQISNYFRKRETRGFVEGLNNKAKATKRRCYGISSIKTFFRDCFWTHRDTLYSLGHKVWSQYEFKNKIGREPTMVSGNMAQILKNITGVSREVVNFGDAQYPWLLAEDITFS